MSNFANNSYRLCYIRRFTCNKSYLRQFVSSIYFKDSNGGLADLFLAVIGRTTSPEIEENSSAVLNSPGDIPWATLSVGSGIAPESGKTS